MFLIRNPRQLLSNQLKELIFASQPERLISFSRLVFSCFALLAVYLDPTRPAMLVEETYFLLVAYVVYSAVLLYLPASATASAFAGVVIHVIDITVLSAEIYLTDGLDSPFFTFYSFSLFTATIRWGWPGAFTTAMALALVLSMVSWDDLEIDFDRDSELNLLIMRGAALFIVAGMLGYLGAYLERSRDRLRRLAAWPVDSNPARQHSPLALHSLRHAVRVLGSPLVIVCWRETACDVGVLAYSSHYSSGIQDIADHDALSALVNGVDKPAFYASQTGGGSEYFRLIQPMLAEFPDRVGDLPALNARCFGLAPFRNQHFQGCVIVLDPKYPSEDIISLTEIVATRICYELEQNLLAMDVAEAAIAQERIRLAHNLHDSVLQDLTAASLMLKAATHQMEDGANSAALQEIGWLLTSQQRRIRQFIELSQDTAIGSTQALSAQLGALITTLERQWGCRIATRITPADLHLKAATATEIFQLVCEATANAVRHGNARHIDIGISETQNQLHIQITDDGTGIADNGDTVQLQPRSIAKRIRDLKGTFDMNSTRQGVSLSLTLPSA